jgi:hypothetical protein
MWILLALVDKSVRSAEFALSRRQFCPATVNNMTPQDHSQPALEVDAIEQIAALLVDHAEEVLSIPTSAKQ